MKTLLVFIVLGTFSFSMAFTRSHLEGLWEDQYDMASDEPESIKLNGKTYSCSNDMVCGCPKLLCTGVETCIRRDDNPIKCKLTRKYEDIDLQNAKIAFFGPGDCKCNPVKLSTPRPSVAHEE